MFSANLGCYCVVGSPPKKKKNTKRNGQIIRKAQVGTPPLKNPELDVPTQFKNEKKTKKKVEMHGI